MLQEDGSFVMKNKLDDKCKTKADITAAYSDYYSCIYADKGSLRYKVKNLTNNTAERNQDFLMLNIEGIVSEIVYINKKIIYTTDDKKVFVVNI